MHPYNRSAFTHVKQFFLDVACLFFVFGLLDVFWRVVFGNPQPERLLWALLAFGAVFLSVMNVRRMYARTTFLYPDRVSRCVLVSGLYATGFCFLLLPFVQPVSRQGLFLALQGFLSFGVVLGQRHAMIIRKNHPGAPPAANGRKSRHCLTIGDGRLVERYRHYMQLTSVQTVFVGFLPLDPAASSAYPALSGLERLLDHLVVDEVLFALPRSFPQDVERAMLLCEERGLTVKVVLDLFRLGRVKQYVHAIGTLPVLTYHTVSLNVTQQLVKRCLDLLGAVVGLMMTGVLALAIVPAIRLDSKGPVLFRQQRIGQNGRPFTMYKFRTMAVGSEQQQNALQERNHVCGGYMFKVPDDPRVTRVGRFLRASSLDELPQFFNVLRGEMSLVGTRPPLPDEVARYGNAHHRRISIKPGLTGLWQVSGRSDIQDFSEVCRLDLSYIDHWSVWLDLMILFRTVGAVARHAGAR